VNRSSRLFLLVATVLASFSLVGTASAAPTFTLTEPVDGQRINGYVSINGYAPVGTTLTAATCAISNTSYSTPFDCLYMTRWISIGHTVNGGEGFKTISIVVTDATGSTSINRTVYNDLTNPNTFIDSGPAQGTTITGTTASWGFSASETSTFECSLDDSGFVPCTTPFNATALEDGEHTFSVRAIDQVGRVDASPATRTINVNNAPPTVSGFDGPEGLTNNDSPGWVFSVSRPDALVDCRIDDGPWTDCTDRNHEATNLVDGPHTFQARAYLAGPTDVQDPPSSVSFTVDTVAPTLSFVSPKSAFGGLSAEFEITSSDTDIDQVSCVVDGNWTYFYNDCDLGTIVNFFPEDAGGEHYIEAWARDEAGNESSSIDWSWTQYPDPPETQIATKPEPSVAVPVAYFGFTSSAGTEFECSVDGGAFVSCPSSHSISGLAGGTHALQVRAKDPAGQLDPSPDSAVFTMLAPALTTLPAPPRPTVTSPKLNSKTLGLKVTGAAMVKATVDLCKKKKVKGKKKIVCSRVTGGTAKVTADGTVTVTLGKKLKKKTKYRVTILVTGADGQTTKLVKTLKTK
jgi:hypothetical protein